MTRPIPWPVIADIDGKGSWRDSGHGLHHDVWVVDGGRDVVEEQVPTCAGRDKRHRLIHVADCSLGGTKINMPHIRAL